MPARVQKRGTKYRVVDPNGRLVRNRAGTPVDGGGQGRREKAARQARAINASMRRRGKL